MNDLQLLSQNHPGKITIDNFSELQATLSAYLDRYQNIVYTESMLAEAKDDKKNLTRLRKELDDRRKEVKRAYLQPYNEFEGKVKELLGLIDAPLNEIKAFIAGMDEAEKAAKRVKIEEFFYTNCAPLGTLAGQVLESPAFFDSKWLNKTTKAKTWQDEVQTKITAAARDLETIQLTGGRHTSALIARYLEALDTKGIAEYRERLDQMDKVDEMNLSATEDTRIGYKVLKLDGTVPQLIQVLELLKLTGIEIEELEDGLPQTMIEHQTPDFDIFVAFDIETTGTFGAGNNDVPAEITEIGAVKVINSTIVERFDELVNPGRKIVPRIARITGITDDMVTDKPGINQIIRKFADFVQGSILLGHNIKASDLYYIDRAAKRAGVVLDNEFFDTYRYARTLKGQQGWEKVTLVYLAEHFGIEQPAAHRAWCDAETNVGVYFKLQKL